MISHGFQLVLRLQLDYTCVCGSCHLRCFSIIFCIYKIGYKLVDFHSDVILRFFWPLFRFQLCIFCYTFLLSSAEFSSLLSSWMVSFGVASSHYDVIDTCFHK